MHILHSRSSSRFSRVLLAGFFAAIAVLANQSIALADDKVAIDFFKAVGELAEKAVEAATGEKKEPVQKPKAAPGKTKKAISITPAIY